MSTGTRIPLAEARALAEEVVGLIQHSCHQVTVAGSIRRQKPDVGDIEIVAVPFVLPSLNLFGEPDSGEPMDALHELCCTLVQEGELSHRPDKHGRPAFGRKYKRLLYDDIPLDLFATTANQYGLILAIRTGPAAWSHRLVTRISAGGLLPDHLQVKDGHLIYRTSGEVIPTPTEQSVFNTIGMDYIAPEDRR